jgi:aspartate beta-hydroxylase
MARVRAAAPEHPAILNSSALAELHRGNAAGARALLERAVAQEPANATLWMNLAITLGSLSLAKEQLQAFERVLEIEPRHLGALLNKGALQERQGKRKAAAKTYHHALQIIPAGASLPNALQPLVRRAIDVTNANDVALADYLAEQLSGLRREHAGEDHTRVDHCIDSLLNRRRIFTPKPTFLYFPKLPALEFYPREHFPWLSLVEAATDSIRAEFDRVFAEDSARLEP